MTDAGNGYTHEISPVFEMFSNKVVITSYDGLILGKRLDDFSGVGRTSEDHSAQDTARPERQG